MKYINLIKKSALATCIVIVLSACTSGNSSSLTSLNLTGTWVGTLQDTPSLAFDVRVIILQEKEFSNSTTDTLPVSYSVTFTKASDGTSTDCAETINNLSATLKLNSGSALLSSQEITAVATNSTISGQAVFNTTCGGPINLRRV